MAPQFNPPNFVRPIDYSGVSLDGIMEGYLRQKQAAQEQGQNLLNYGFDPRQVTPQVLQQAGQAAPQAQTFAPTAPAAPNMMAPMGAQDFAGALGQQASLMNAPKVDSMTPTYQAPAQESPLIAHVRAFIANRKTREAADIGATNAASSEKNAKAQLDLANARLADRKPLGLNGGGSTLTPTQSAALQWGIDQGLVSTEDISSRGPRSAIMADGIAGRPDFQAYNAERQRTGRTGLDNFNPRANSINTAAAKAGASASARLTEGGASQVVARAANSAKEQLDILQEMSDKFPRSDVRFMNTAINAIDSQTYPEAQNWRVALNSARTEYATALNRGNSPTDELMNEARAALPDNITPRQLPGAIATLRRGLDATVKGQMTAAGSGSRDAAPPVAVPSDTAQLIKRLAAQGYSRAEIRAELSRGGH